MVRCSAYILCFVLSASMTVVAVGDEPNDSSLLGDFNEDGRLDEKDIDALSQAVLDGGNESRFDVNEDGVVDDNDRQFWVRDLKRTWFGDANMNGIFNTGELVQVFKAGEYEDSLPGNSGWAEGDWSGDFEFDSRDITVAFQDGGYLNGPRASSVAAVPEPASCCLLAIGMLAALRYRRRRASC